MKVKIRKAIDSDKKAFVNFALKLSKFNRSNHKQRCKYDEYDVVLKSIQGKAEETFINRNRNTLILIAEFNNKTVGYALGRIFQQDETVDNGTGRMGLLDELFIEEKARGMGLGQKLINETMNWMEQNNISRIKLYAYSWNNNAIKFYERNGFKKFAVSFEKFI